MENKDLPLHYDFWVSLAEFLTLVLLIFLKPSSCYPLKWNGWQGGGSMNKDRSQGGDGTRTSRHEARNQRGDRLIDIALLWVDFSVKNIIALIIGVFS